MYVSERKINALGTYGTMRSTGLFLVGVIRRSAHDLEDFGAPETADRGVSSSFT
jgi:hypothetical protein